MKQFKLSDYLEPEENFEWAHLEFPSDYTLNERPDLTIYYDVTKDKPYTGSFDVWFGDYSDNVKYTENMDKSEVEAFVNECFQYMRANYVQYLVDGVLFRSLDVAEQHANGKPIVKVHGPYYDEKLYEFYEGDGKFED